MYFIVLWDIVVLKNTMGPEAKLYKKFKKATPTISYSRIENLALPGVPDTLGYTKYNQFFTS